MRSIKELIKKIDQRTLKLIPIIKKYVFRIKPVSYYVELCEFHMDNNKSRKGLTVLNKGLKHYPNSLYLNRLKANIEMENGNNDLANTHWDFLIKRHDKKLAPEDFIRASENLLELKKEEESLKSLEQGLLNYPSNIHFLKRTSKYYVDNKDWKKVINTLTKVFISNEYNPKANDYIDLSQAYYEENYSDKAEYVLQMGMEKNRDNHELLIAYINLSILLYKWDLASNLITHLTLTYNLDYSIEQKTTYGMIYQLAGKKNKSVNMYKDVLTNYSSDHKKDFKHQKITIFDNGETRIDFYKRNTNTDKAIITFDSINMTWDKPPFGFKLLTEQNIDIIAVRKREPKTYQQDLSLEDFLRTVKPLSNSYKTVISYGFSLGAYSAVYYTGELGCQILALAPRLSIHPIYGKSQEVGKIPFHHNLQLRKNRHVRPIIVYDPKNRIDNTYVSKEILTAYPDAHLVKIPYSGHSMGPNLLRMGLLKEFILTVIHDEKVPVYNRKAKVHSANYYRHLGSECLKRGKLPWAIEIVNRAYELLPEDVNIVQLKVDTLILECKYSEAEELIHKNLKSKPKNLSYRIMLINFYISQNNILMADYELNKSESLFEDIKQFNAKQLEIDELYHTFVNGIVK